MKIIKTVSLMMTKKPSATKFGAKGDNEMKLEIRRLKSSMRNGQTSALQVCLFICLLLCALTAVAQTREEKLALAEKTFDEAVILFNKQTLESYQTAREKFLEARRLCREVGEKTGEAESLIFAGTISNNLGEKQQALEYYNQALSLFQDVSNKGWEALTLNNIGGVNYSLGENQKALEFFNQSLALSRELGNKALEALNLNNIGSVYYNLGEKEKALEFFIQSLPLSRQVGDKAAEARTLNNIGEVASSLGEKQKALEFYNESLLLRRQVGDKGGEARTLNNIGKVYDDLGEKQKALELLNQSLLLSKQVGDKVTEAATLFNIGKVYDDLGEKQMALKHYNQSLLLFNQVEYKQGKAATLTGIGKVYDDLGEREKALEFYNQSLTLSRQVGDIKDETRTLNNIGSAYSELGENEKALEYYIQSLSLSKQLGDKASEAITLNNIGKEYSELGENEKALEFYNQSLLLSRQVGDKGSQALILNNIGKFYYDLDEKRKALEYFNKALLLHLAVGDTSGEALTLNNVMNVWVSLKNARLAIFYGKQSVNAYQQLRSNIQGLEKQVQQTYLKSVEYSYRHLAENLISNGRLPEALQVLNSFKDQQFFDFNQSPSVQTRTLSRSPREVDFAARYEKTSGRFGTIGSQLEELKRTIGSRQPNVDENARLQKLENDLKVATDEFLTVLKQAETEFSKPEDEKDKVGEVSDFKEMQFALLQLNEQTGQKAAAVYQLVGEKNFSALIITQNGIEKVSNSVKGEELNEKALQLWALLQSDRYDTTVLSKQLYEAVFKPMEEKLPAYTTTIMWALDGNLRYLPMAALFDGRQFLAERYNHAVFTRADRERMTRKVSPTWMGTGFGSSQATTIEVLGEQVSFKSLPGVNAELAAVFKNEKGGVLGGAVLPDRQFNRKNFLEALRQKRPLVHIASHFSFRPGDEARSFLLLGDGTAFTLEEMKRETNLFDGVELLTLSACNTAAQQTGANGREIDGFAELAQRLGAGAVMATLWQVSDASTPWLMREFYTTRQGKSRMTKAAALQQAQIALLKGTAETKPLPEAEKGAVSKLQVIVNEDGKRDASDTRADIIYVGKRDAPLHDKTGKPPFAHPYYWSPFILIGNWK